MQSLIRRIEEAFTEALVSLVESGEPPPPAIAPTRDDKHGDYQCNAALGLARKLGRSPRELAGALAAAVGQAHPELFSELTVAGPGFINLRLRDEALAGHLDELFPWQASPTGERVVVDYSSPNIAKQMHVGHIRSTILGDAICRILGALGHEVVRQNHVGDWGTQFGLLCAWLMDRGQPVEEAALSDLEALYRQAQALASDDPDFRERSRRRVVALHQGDPDTVAVWRRIVEVSTTYLQTLYDRLGVLLKPEDLRGESFYNPLLPEIVEELSARFPRGTPALEVMEDQGALCAFLTDPDGAPLFLTPEGQPQPLIIRKSDGAYLYPTTDLAALRYRRQTLGADRIIYVTDARQALHFQMFFAAARAAGWVGEASLEHVTFGSVLGPDGKPLKTRTGENVRLVDLLDEAEERAAALVEEAEADPTRRRGFSAGEIREIARAVGLASIKYADLAQNRASDYTFSFDRMLSMEGNTAPYLLYAYARIRSVERRSGEALPERVEWDWADPAERRLALHLARFPETVESAATGWRVNHLCEHLYQLAGHFMRFYEACPVLNAPSPGLRTSRLALSRATARALQTGLGLLGIPVLERM